MTAELKHKSVYIGLFFTQLLAVICNAFLDIQYGKFTFEVVFWTLLYGYAIKVAISQNGVRSEYGDIRMRRMLVFGAILTALVFLPMWALPRAMSYMLVMLQIAYTCTTTTRKQLYMNLLMSLVLVLYAANHYRADWTMLFYLIPYVICSVFTMVSEQINSQVDVLKAQSLSNAVISGQAVTIAAATLSILLLGVFLYWITPQTFIFPRWFGFGSPAVMNTGVPNSTPQNKSSQPASGSGLFSEWPGPQEMRAAAARSGMPEWQADSIRRMADLTDGINQQLAPLKKAMRELRQSFLQWLAEHMKEIIRWLMLLSLVAILLALLFLMRESKVSTWIQARLDYLRLNLYLAYGSRDDLAAKYYFATERLFELKDIQRKKQMSVMDYVVEVDIYYGENIHELKQLAKYFEDYRYGQKPIDQAHLEAMHGLYKKIYRSVFR